MRRSRGPLVWGLLLILGGLLLLAQNFNLFGPLSAPIWAVVFGAASLAFLAAYFSRRGAWWFLIPAFVFAGLTAAVILSELDGQGELAGSAFLWSIGAAFWAVYLTNRSQWWPIIPAGVMTTIGAIPVIADRVPGTATGAVFFVGLGSTFGILYLMRSRFGGDTSWAMFPAVGCLAMALVLGVLGPLEQFWPVIFLILPGLYLLYNALRPRDAGGPGGSASN